MLLRPLPVAAQSFLDWGLWNFLSAIFAFVALLTLLGVPGGAMFVLVRTGQTERFDRESATALSIVEALPPERKHTVASGVWLPVADAKD